MWTFIAGIVVGLVGGIFLGISFGIKIAGPYFLQTLEDEGYELIPPRKG